MSFPHGSSRPDEGMESYYENTMQSGWVGVEAVCKKKINVMLELAKACYTY